jgi:hypothetical protein
MFYFRFHYYFTVLSVHVQAERGVTKILFNPPLLKGEAMPVTFSPPLHVRLILKGDRIIQSKERIASSAAGGLAMTEKEKSEGNKGVIIICLYSREDFHYNSTISSCKETPP